MARIIRCILRIQTTKDWAKCNLAEKKYEFIFLFQFCFRFFVLLWFSSFHRFNLDVVYILKFSIVNHVWCFIYLYLFKTRTTIFGIYFNLLLSAKAIKDLIILISTSKFFFISVVLSLINHLLFYQ